MAPLNMTMHNAVGKDFVVCTLYIVLHEYQRLFIIPSSSTFILDINHS